MKKIKKIKLEDLKIQSFSTSHLLSKDETEKLIGGTGQGCTMYGQPCTYTNGCLCPTANPNCTAEQCSNQYGCGGGSGTETNQSDCCTQQNCNTPGCYDSQGCYSAAYYNC